MFEEVKSVLDSLSSALGELQRKIADVDKQKEENRIARLKQDELDIMLKQKAEDLNTREGNVRHIESIVEFSESAKKLMAEARALMTNADERQAILEKRLKQLADSQAKLEAEYQDKEKAQKKQAEALIKERKEFEDKLKAYKAMAAAVK